MRLNRAIRWLIIVALFAMSAVGCTTLPDFAHPGPAAVQRAQAIQHDPYPLNDIAPEIVGGRPLSYQQSLTEAARAKLTPAAPVVIQSRPAPGMNVVAPPVASSPYAVAPPQPAAPLAPTYAPTVTAAKPASGPPIVTSPYPMAPAPVASPYPPPPAPMVTSPYPGATAPAMSTRPLQSRAPY